MLALLFFFFFPVNFLVTQEILLNQFLRNLGNFENLDLWEGSSVATMILRSGVMHACISSTGRLREVSEIRARPGQLSYLERAWLNIFLKKKFF